MLERGAHVSFANCGLPYFVGGEITEESKLLVQTPQSLRAALDLDVRTGSDVIDAVIPGRWAAPPAPAMITFSPRLRALLA